MAGEIVAGVSGSDGWVPVDSAEALDALLDGAPDHAATLAGAGERRLVVALGPYPGLLWEDEVDVQIGVGPVPDGTDPADTVADIPEDFPPHVQAVLAATDWTFEVPAELVRQAGHEFLRTGERPRCVLWITKP
ncbi:hypothetical protein CS0771_66830 [Catellatospora sp. IY07-71]|uniref:Imm1 family immunity protein n=1 Tax=Catellatospora sp. IY07-71 TaxID=2728827 RepID=UPI001BB34076|nr:Imm1 family immunity protein [Catellatospora sp. IY07-71]BCJ77139.1 hypothetical protein CS0771_66830 [Catellatospora sp. IY07-71]